LIAKILVIQSVSLVLSAISKVFHARATAHSFAKSDNSVTLTPASSKLKPRRYPLPSWASSSAMLSLDGINCCSRNGTEPAAHPIISFL
jgi:hypothetical protein